jgi:hypothetical protein
MGRVLGTKLCAHMSSDTRDDITAFWMPARARCPVYETCGISWYMADHLTTEHRHLSIVYVP